MGKKNKKPQEELPEIPHGVPKSGRVWKNLREARTSSMVDSKPLKTSWQTKMKEKNEKRLMKLHEKELKDMRSAALEAARKRTEEKKQMKLENQRKSEVVQTIKDTRKIKRMKKKQLRMIEKR